MQMDEQSDTHQVKVMQCTNQQNANLDFTLNPRATGPEKNFVARCGGRSIANLLLFT